MGAAKAGIVLANAIAAITKVTVNNINIRLIYAPPFL
jgi:hypothetical protein